MIGVWPVLWCGFPEGVYPCPSQRHPEWRGCCVKMRAEHSHFERERGTRNKERDLERQQSEGWTQTWGGKQTATDAKTAGPAFSSPSCRRLTAIGTVRPLPRALASSSPHVPRLPSACPPEDPALGGLVVACLAAAEQWRFWLPWTGCVSSLFMGPKATTNDLRKGSSLKQARALEAREPRF